LLTLLTLALLAFAFVFVWLIFRLERAAERRAAIAAARATLVATQRGIVLGMPELGDAYQGWGRLYFSKSVNGSMALAAGDAARKLVEHGTSYQLYRVPVGPLERLAAPVRAGGLVSEQTVHAANLALTRITVFNQMVDKQTSFNVAHAVEIADSQTPPERRQAISLAARQMATALHLDGIGRAGETGGWYRRLTEALSADIRRLDQLRESSWWRNYNGASYLLIGDVLAVLVCAAVIGVGAVRAYDEIHDDGSPASPAQTEPVPTTPATSSTPSPGGAGPHRTTTIRGSTTVRGLWP
jgi:hypothetical protein